jgi:hypothetical protein
MFISFTSTSCRIEEDVRIQLTSQTSVTVRTRDDLPPSSPELSDPPTRRVSRRESEGFKGSPSSLPINADCANPREKAEGVKGK